MYIWGDNMLEQEYYVYCLCDPINCKVFYIGKGKGNRANSHLYEHRVLRIVNAKKHNKISEIVLSGNTPIIKFLSRNLTERQSLSIEKDLIKKYKHRLTNISYGESRKEDRDLAFVNDLLCRVIPKCTWVNNYGERGAQIYDYVLNSLLNIKNRLSNG